MAASTSPELPLATDAPCVTPMRIPNWWDDDGIQFEEEMCGFQDEASIEEGPMTEAEVQALLGLKPDSKTSQSSHAQTIASPTSSSSAGLVHGPLSPTTSQASTPTAGSIVDAVYDEPASPPAATRKLLRSKAPPSGYYIEG